MRNAIIFSITSDIAYELSLKLLEEGYSLYGTYNTLSKKIETLKAKGVKLYKCDLLDDEQIHNVLIDIKKDCNIWEVLVLAQASMNPIGSLNNIDLNDWEKSIKLNFINQIKIIVKALEFKADNSSVITFAGGGTNNATKNFSAYTISKIALIKMMELLYEENKDTKFTCIGPGWVKTKIHNETLDAKDNAKEAYEDTLTHLENDDFTDMSKVINCIMWTIKEDIEVISGRNFSVKFDDWDTKQLKDGLLKNHNMYKLRREGNTWKK